MEREPARRGQSERSERRSCEAAHLGGKINKGLPFIINYD